MDFENGKFLLDIYKNYKDLQHFFLDNDYQQSLISFFNILKPLIPIKNIAAFFLKNKQDKDFFYVYQIEDCQLLEYIHTHHEKTISSYHSSVHYLLICPLINQNTYYGELLFIRDIHEGDFTQKDKEVLKDIAHFYTSVFIDKDTYLHNLLNNNTIFSQFLDNIKANVLITNPHTDEILYINEHMKKNYRLDNPIRIQCWKVLQKNAYHRCDNCPVKLLIENPQQCYSWEEMSSFDNHVYQNYDCMVEWFDHSLVHFQYSVDITAIKQLTIDASFDELTGIYNRKFGKQALQNQILKARDDNKNIILCLFDIDHLKQINDSYGHHDGDYVISTIASYVRKTLNSEDVFLRLSGDEFLLSFYDNTTDNIHEHLNQILNDLESLKHDENLPYYLSFCYGLYKITPDCSLSLNEMITHADEKMYKWKKHNHLKKALDDLKKNSPVQNQFDYNKDLLYDALVKSTDDYIFICNMKDNIFKYTPSMVEEFDFPSEILTNAAAVFGTKIHPDDRYEFLNSNQLIADGRTDSHIVEYRALNKNNEYVWLRCHGHVEYDQDGEPSLFAGFITNLGKKNYRDNLTGLFNQFELEKRINETAGPFALMILNINDFKSINQLFNRDFGDNVLRIIGQNLQTLLHKDATVFKLESDEFGIMFKNIDIHSIQHIYQQIEKYSQDAHSYEDKHFTIQFNAGCVLSPKDGNTYLELRKNCEIALQYSRLQAQPHLILFHSHLSEEKTYSLQLINALKQDILNDFENFSLVFQPKFKSHSHKLIGFEALCRWKNPYFQNIGPDTFIPILENSGDIIPLGKWIFNQSLLQLKEWILYNSSIMMSINVSHVQLMENNFVLFIEQTLHKYHIPAQQVIIELTETAIAQSAYLVIQRIKELRALGVQIAMDDFGKGYSSLSLLKDEPLDIIKIDRSFVKDIKKDTFNATFMKSMIELCHQIQLKVVVEGIETKGELEIIETFNPDYIQGYYTGKPMQTDDSIQLILKKNVDN